MGPAFEHRLRVFERFYSILGNTANGSGLGLAIVKEIARMHGAVAGIDANAKGMGIRVSMGF